VKAGRFEDSNEPDPGADVPSTVTAIEDALVQNCVSGDADAWRALHRRYYPVAAAFLRKLGTRERDVKDACQDVFVSLPRYLPTLRGQADLKTWLYLLCVSEARRARSRARLLHAIRERLRGLLAPEPMVPTARRMQSPSLKQVGTALDKMSASDRLVFVLYEFEGLPGKQIAAIAGCPQATVWRRLDHARRIFRAALGIAESEAVGVK
jgi:RNA polymerase sigma-70 factor, ECF subfamily